MFSAHFYQLFPEGGGLQFSDNFHSPHYNFFIGQGQFTIEGCYNMLLISEEIEKLHKLLKNFVPLLGEDRKFLQSL